MRHNLFLLLLLTVVNNIQGDHQLNSKNDFPINHDKRLVNNWLVHTNTPLCVKPLDILNKNVAHLRDIGTLNDAYAHEFFDPEVMKPNVCVLACVEIGYPLHLVNKIFPQKLYIVENENFEESHLVEWFSEECSRKEIGFVSSHHNVVNLFWLNPETKEKVPVGEVERGEQNTLWQESFIGHEIEAVDSETQELLGKYVIMHDSFFIVGAPESLIQKDYISEGYEDNESAIKDALRNEYERSVTIKRTFTPVGFSKSRLPSDLFASMSAFYYNNRNNLKLEEWSDKGVFVNWWEQNSHLIVMPWKLKVTCFLYNNNI